jgi:hypothetical protein
MVRCVGGVAWYGREPVAIHALPLVDCQLGFLIEPLVSLWGDSTYREPLWN